MKFTAIIPTRRNNGRLVPKRELNGILSALGTRFGGMTIEGRTDGRWTDDDGTEYADAGLKVVIVCDNERLMEAREMVIAVGRQLGQIKMYFEVKYYDGVYFLTVE